MEAVAAGDDEALGNLVKAYHPQVEGLFASGGGWNERNTV
jgi:hypothetical protein